MEFGDIINFLLIIAFAIIAPIVGAVSKSRNKKAAPSNPSGNTQSFNDVISSFSNEIEELRRQKANAFAENRSEHDFADERSVVEEFVPEHVPEPEKLQPQVVSRSEKLRESFKQNVNTQNSARSIAKSFDIKKAVIYSEIMDTKYF